MDAAFISVRIDDDDGGGGWTRCCRYELHTSAIAIQIGFRVSTSIGRQRATLFCTRGPLWQAIGSWSHRARRRLPQGFVVVALRREDDGDGRRDGHDGVVVVVVLLLVEAVAGGVGRSRRCRCSRLLLGDNHASEVRQRMIGTHEDTGNERGGGRRRQEVCALRCCAAVCPLVSRCGVAALWSPRAAETSNPSGGEVRSARRGDEGSVRVHAVVWSLVAVSGLVSGVCCGRVVGVGPLVRWLGSARLVWRARLRAPARVNLSPKPPSGQRSRRQTPGNVTTNTYDSNHMRIGQTRQHYIPSALILKLTYHHTRSQ